MMTGAAVFPIGYVSITTGLSTHVLRAWERRYGAVVPIRTASGRRMYTKGDMERLTLLKQAVHMGHSISQIAGLDDETLAGLTASRSMSPPPQTPRRMRPSSGGPSDDHGLPQTIDDCLQATKNFDGIRLHHILNRASLTQSRQTVIEKIIVPLMQKIGSRWSRGDLRIAHGHLASNTVAAYLNSIVYSLHDVSPACRRILVATPAGQFCYLGALAVAVFAQEHGWHPVFLGANLPGEEIAAACLSLSPNLVALSITCCADENFVERELNQLAMLLDDQYPLLVGGKCCDAFRKTIEQSGGRICLSLRQLSERL